MTKIKRPAIDNRSSNTINILAEKYLTHKSPALKISVYIGDSTVAMSATANNKIYAKWATIMDRCSSLEIKIFLSFLRFAFDFIFNTPVIFRQTIKF